MIVSWLRHSRLYMLEYPVVSYNVNLQMVSHIAETCPFHRFGDVKARVVHFVLLLVYPHALG